MKKLILVTMIISFSSLSIFAASKSEINKLVKYECENFEIENSIGIKNPFSRSDRPNRFCHMKN
jgi:hypothetical protein